MVRLTRAIEFSSSLRYRQPQLSDVENARLFGPAARTHGHNYRLEVTVRGEPDAVSGMVIDLKDLKTILEREIEDRFDHRDLVDDTSYFEKQTATPENFARVIFELLGPALAGLLDRVRLYQDPDHFVDVSAEAAHP